jgi:hypothetical protein
VVWLFGAVFQGLTYAYFKTQIMKTKINQQSTISFAPSPLTMADLSSTFFPLQTETIIATPLFTNSTPFFGN